MASPPPGQPAWSITVHLRHRHWLEFRASAENVFPGWGHGGERLSLLLRLSRSLRLAITSRCGLSPASASPKNPRPFKIIRFLKSKLARVPSIWRRKKPPAHAAAATSKPGSLSQSRALAWPWPAHRERTWTARKTALCLVTVLAVAMASTAASRAMKGYGRGYYEPVAHCASWRCFAAKKLAKFLQLEPRLYEWLLKNSLKGLLNW
ncbi:hypothetical protein GUJ93_ZPchr0001g29887 [Zizania palustris]|uniref:Uncharacterized protein n=1 Tax=Zizania palustris TaxID=103762 RepID=A0A8J5RSF4_ZIZPA|nr:hypothetical protein GUJ93_ZPchr0001g29887 [Zizania palustris]